MCLDLKFGKIINRYTSLQLTVPALYGYRNCNRRLQDISVWYDPYSAGTFNRTMW